MKHVETQIEEEFVLFEKYNLNPNELFFLKMILLSQEEDSQDAIYRYFKLPEEVRGSITIMLHNLQNKGIILKSYKVPGKGETFSPLDVPLSKNFQTNFFRCSYEMGRELYEIYPKSIVVNGNEYKLRRVSNKFDSLEDSFRYYGKAIRWNPEKHKHVLELVELGKENGYNFTNLGSFLVDHDWNNIEALELDGAFNEHLKVV